MADLETATPALEESPAPDSPSPLEWARRAARWAWLLVWPWHATTPLEVDAEEGEREDAALRALPALSESDLRDALRHYREHHEYEEDRRKGADAKLSSILALSSVVTAITFGFFSVAFDGAFATRLGRFGTVGTIVFLYAVLQLVIAIRASIKGLHVGIFEEPSVTDGLLRPGESRTDQLVREIRVYAEVCRSHEGMITERLGRVEVAHRAVHNFFIALLALVAMIAFAVVRRPGAG